VARRRQRGRKRRQQDGGTGDTAGASDKGGSQARGWSKGDHVLDGSWREGGRRRISSEDSTALRQCSGQRQRVRRKKMRRKNLGVRRPQNPQVRGRQIL
jgi:hypothetical protein